MNTRTLTVEQLNQYVKGVFEDELVLHGINVEGEVFEYKQTSSATFVTLREKDSILYCVCFGTVEKLEIGDKVSLYGRVSFYERSGKISFVFDSVKRMGEGDLNARFRELRDKLQSDGVFDSKKEIKAPIRRIAVITSETGAVIHDFITTVHRKRKFTDIYLYPASVQGKSAAAEMLSRVYEADGGDYDVIVICRGGGSGDDLSVFNDETLVRAIAACSTPVISAVGHETDFTLCDFAASLRAGTPSMAGEYISRANEEFFERFGGCVESLTDNIGYAISNRIDRLYRAAAALSYKSEIKLEQVGSKINGYAAGIAARAQHVSELTYIRLRRLAELFSVGIDGTLNSNRMRLSELTERVNKNNPLRILSMGYAKLYTADGKKATFDEIDVGDEIEAIVEDGKISATVTDKIKSRRV